MCLFVLQQRRLGGAAGPPGSGSAAAAPPVLVLRRPVNRRSPSTLPGALLHQPGDGDQHHHQHHVQHQHGHHCVRLNPLHRRRYEPGDRLLRRRLNDRPTIGGGMKILHTTDGIAELLLQPNLGTLWDVDSSYICTMAPIRPPTLRRFSAQGCYIYFFMKSVVRRCIAGLPCLWSPHHAQKNASNVMDK